MHAEGWKPRHRQAEKTRDRKRPVWYICSNKAPYVRQVKKPTAGEPLSSLRWCRLQAGARRNEEEQPTEEEAFWHSSRSCPLPFELVGLQCSRSPTRASCKRGSVGTTGEPLGFSPQGVSESRPYRLVALETRVDRPRCRSQHSTDGSPC
jgi:hypothetical protein